VRSLNWEVAKGPLWRSEEEIQRENEANQKSYFDIDDAANESQQTDQLSTSESEATPSRASPMIRFSHSKNASLFR
jgi:hypothetical protein